MSPLNLQLGDVLRMRRPHPCGSIVFQVVRLGADIGLRCTVCSRRILLARGLLARRMAGFVSRTPEIAPPTDLDLEGLDPPAPAP